MQSRVEPKLTFDVAAPGDEERLVDKRQREIIERVGDIAQDEDIADRPRRVAPEVGGLRRGTGRDRTAARAASADLALGRVATVEVRAGEIGGCLGEWVSDLVRRECWHRNNRRGIATGCYGVRRGLAGFDGVRFDSRGCCGSTNANEQRWSLDVPACGAAGYDVSAILKSSRTTATRPNRHTSHRHTVTLSRCRRTHSLRNVPLHVRRQLIVLPHRRCSGRLEIRLGGAGPL